MIPRNECQLCVLMLCVCASAWAFNGNNVKEGPLRLIIADIPEISQYDSPAPVNVTVKNEGESPLAVELEIGGLVDQWRAVGKTKQSLNAPPGADVQATFRIEAAKGAYSAHYPVHVWARFEHKGKRITAHAIQIFVPKFANEGASSAEPTDMKPLHVPAKGGLSLYDTDLQRVAWRYFDKPLVYKAQGWQGSDPQCRCCFTRWHSVTRGTVRRAITMHPPWVPTGGTIFADYLLVLPNVKPIKLAFANAIRDNTAKEPPSDGVTFRVWAGDKVLFKRHTASKVWVDGEADLSDYAGQQVLLRLESHPGPAHNTTCDSSYWAEPTIVTGTPPKLLTKAEKDAMRGRARRIVKTGAANADDEVVFHLGDGADDCLAAAVLGPHGLFDGVIAFGRGDKCVTFDGIPTAVLGQTVGGWPTSIVQKNLRTTRTTAGVSLVHTLDVSGVEVRLVVKLDRDRKGLRVSVGFPQSGAYAGKFPESNPLRITDSHLGAADQKAPRVYYGHGYCIVEPKAFRAGYGGHNLSTSHVGFDFERGVSLLLASSVPPDYLEVSPDEQLYALHAHHDLTFTFVPGLAGAFDCAIEYRPLFEKKPAGGVKRMAGRFCFDIWGGRYADIAQAMQRMIDYGLTDSFITVHAWQRWGYDYRLPDVWPPQPRLGTVADMRKIADVCAKHDIPWGLHDNYIDFYPDAADYSYDRICFNKSGRPIRAWINRGRDAQSYRWRPDCIMPFVQRNLKLIKPAVAPTQYFIDVFTSSGGFDYYDVTGKFHSRLETSRCWGEAFAWIRDYLGGNAPTSSEAGSDHLIGYLDGADCQHLMLTSKPQRFRIYLPCEDWERVPWFDSVLHDKFILHGVGYSGRYQGGRSRRAHGISSDDYITAELLEGHALMIDSGGFGRGAVRKYWLAQDFIRSIALDAIERVQFVEGDIHRQIVTWRSGGVVWVNRSEADWAVEGKVLPQYGCLAKNGPIESSIERIGGIFVEQSKAPGRWYFNARTLDPDKRLRVTPTVKGVEYLGGNKFKLLTQWQADEPAPKDLVAFVHFTSPKSKRYDKIAFQGDHRPKLGTSQWRGQVVTKKIVHVPDKYGPGKYPILVGLYDPKAGRRYGLHGEEAGSSAYLIGTLVVEGKAGKIGNIRVVPNEPKPEPPARLNVDKRPIDFGPVVTDGAFRLQVKAGQLVVTSLPDQPGFALTLRLDRLGMSGRAAKSLAAVDRAGAKVRAAEFEQQGAALSFKTQAGEFAYVIGF